MDFTEYVAARRTSLVRSAVLLGCPQPDAGHHDDPTNGLAVRQALAAMSHEHREMLVLRFYADLSERDTADALKLPLGTVKSRTARALAALAADGDLTGSHDAH